MKGITNRQIEFALQCCMQKDRCAKCPYRDGKGVCFNELHKDVFFYIQRLKKSGNANAHTRAPARNVAKHRGQRSE